MPGKPPKFKSLTALLFCNRLTMKIYKNSNAKLSGRSWQILSVHPFEKVTLHELLTETTLRPIDNDKF